MPYGKHTRRPQIGRAWARMLCVALVSSASPTLAAPDLKRPLLASRVSVPAPPPLPAAPVHAILRIDKSENRNQVFYGARVDAACRPKGASPVYAYWRMRERGPNATENLLDHEQQAYGIEMQSVLARSKQGGSVRVQLRAWPDRPVELQLFRAANGCAARALLDIQGMRAILQSIYIDIGFLFSVNYALLRGIRITEGTPIHEKLRR
jgi:hypothetical protein